MSFKHQSYGYRYPWGMWWKLSSRPSVQHSTINNNPRVAVNLIMVQKLGAAIRVLFSEVKLQVILVRVYPAIVVVIHRVFCKTSARVPLSLVGSVTTLCPWSMCSSYIIDPSGLIGETLHSHQRSRAEASPSYLASVQWMSFSLIVVLAVPSAN